MDRLNCTPDRDNVEAVHIDCRQDSNIEKNDTRRAFDLAPWAARRGGDIEMAVLLLATGELLPGGVQGHDPIGWRGTRMAICGLSRECPLKKRGDSGRHTGESRDVWRRLHLRELAVRAIGKSELLDGG